LRYLSRYTHRVAIANRRLIAMDDVGVTFRWEDYRTKGRTKHRVMTLSADEFIRRFCHYGFMANGKRRDGLAKIRRLLSTEDAEPLSAATGDHTECDQEHARVSDQSTTYICPDCRAAMRWSGRCESSRALRTLKSSRGSLPTWMRKGLSPKPPGGGRANRLRCRAAGVADQSRAHDEILAPCLGDGLNKPTFCSATGGLRGGLKTAWEWWVSVATGNGGRDQRKTGFQADVRTLCPQPYRDFRVADRQHGNSASRSTSDAHLTGARW
jgi:hypothetical protein